jgi:hypothetical protein
VAVQPLSADCYDRHHTIILSSKEEFQHAVGMRCGSGADALGSDDADMGFADAIADDLFRAAECSTHFV